MVDEDQLYTLFNSAEFRKNPLFEKYSKELRKVDQLSKTEVVDYVSKFIVNKDNKVEHKEFIRILLEKHLIDINKVIKIITEGEKDFTKIKIENSSDAEKIIRILNKVDEDYRFFITILLHTGQDKAAVLLDPTMIDLTNFSRCDPSYGYVSHFSFGDKNPDEEFYVEAGKPPNSKSTAYAMNGEPRGFCYLLNNYFTIGTYKEMQRFRNIFHKLQFKVIMRKNMNANDIYEELKELSQKDDLTQHNAFVFMSISHGNAEGEIYGFDDNTLKIQDLMNLFNNDNCPNMRKKPKLFCFNCCRGDSGVLSLSKSTDQALDKNKSEIDPTDDSELIRTIKMNLPNVSHFYLIYSTLYGYVAHVDWNTGTIFGKVLADSFLERVNYRDINGLICRANEKIEESHPSFRQRFQITQQGTRDLFFT